MLTGVLFALLAVHAIAAIAACVHVLFYYRRPAAAVAWLFALLFLPLVGSILYLVLAVYGGPRSVRRRRKEAASVRGSRDGSRDGADAYPTSLARAGLARLMRGVCRFPLTAGNGIRLIVDDEDALHRQLAAIRGATEQVLLQTYVLKPGRTLELLSDALVERARAGVDVRLLIDPVGSQMLSERVLQDICARGVAAQTFLRPNPLKGRFQINFRNHRKLLLVDSRTAYIGGRNWSDEYFSEFSGADAFRDTTFELRGPVLAGLQRVFLEDWSIALDDESVLVQEAVQHDAAGDVLARTLPAGPDEPRDDPRDVLAGAFRAARRSIFVVTPYFVPGPILHRALRIAALSGVDVDLLIPRRCGKRSIDLAAQYYFDGLLESGVRIWLCEPPLMHAKAIVVDGLWSSVGSVNLDHRSIHLNYELNLEVVDERFARSLREYFEPDLAHSQQVDAREFLARGIRRRVLENAAALFEPLM